MCSCFSLWPDVCRNRWPSELVFNAKSQHCLMSPHTPALHSACCPYSCFDCGLLHAFLSVVHPSQQANITSHCSLVGVSPAVFLYACTSALFSFSVLNSCPCISAFFCTCGRVSEPGLVMHAVQVVCHRAIPQACLHPFMHKGTVWALER